MGLSEEIKQKNFQSERQKALINILYTNNYAINEINVYLKEINITRQQYNVLRILRGQHPNPASVNLIKERMLDKMSDASRIVARLESKKLINRATSSQDRRAVEIEISDEGLDVLADIDRKTDGFEHIMGNISEEESKLLNELLDKVRTKKRIV